jgi:putative membrane protein
MTAADLLISAVTQGPGALFGLLALAAGPWLVAAAGEDAPTAAAAGAVLVSVALVAAALRVVFRVVTEWKWTMTSRGDDLQVRAGLLDVREQSVPRRRIQQVTLVDNPLRRLLGLTSVVLHTAVPAAASDGASPLVEVPLLRRADVPQFLARVMGPGWVVPALEPRHPAAARRAVTRRLLLLLPGSVGPGLVFGGPAWLTAVVALMAVPWGRAAHRGARHAVDDRWVALASGVLHHRLDLVPVDRIQSTRTRSSPAQRRLGLATFRLDIAGSTWVGPLTRSPGLFDMDATTAARLRDTLPS